MGLKEGLHNFYIQKHNRARLTFFFEIKHLEKHDEEFLVVYYVKKYFRGNYTQDTSRQLCG